ncbi:hypothetical protein B0H17DRAFT_1130246 [Mycena rosella]|uniref:Uncharacterized protein n=1 Tax=Mycena rosella TaxID=1033263 RepID=A0AAD7DSZ5_MYCRO|nr:hypothetical protein B0H17DRAFT_1130246 [Mycena rosella]
MSVFGSSTHDNKLQKPNHAAQLESTGYGNAPTDQGFRQTNDPRLANDPLAPGTGTVGMGEPGMGNPTTGGGRHHAPMGAGMHNDGMMADQQYGAGVGGGGIPPTGVLSSQHQQQQPHSGGGAMTGKIEHAIGSIIGSKSLKAKGIQKEQEARGLKVQSQELAEAERLEQEAGLRRERAVAHGAHPDNRHVGGVVPTGPGAYN